MFAIPKQGESCTLVWSEKVNIKQVSLQRAHLKDRPLLIKTHTQTACVKGPRTGLEGSFHPMSCHIRVTLPPPSASQVVTILKKAGELFFSRFFFFFFSGCGYYTDAVRSHGSPLHCPHTFPETEKLRIVWVQCRFQLTGATRTLHKLLAAGKCLGLITWQVLRHALLLILSGNPNVRSLNWDFEQREKFGRTTLALWVGLIFTPCPFLPISKHSWGSSWQGLSREIYVPIPHSRKHLRIWVRARELREFNPQSVASNKNSKISLKYKLYIYKDHQDLAKLTWEYRTLQIYIYIYGLQTFEDKPLAPFNKKYWTLKDNKWPAYLLLKSYQNGK